MKIESNGDALWMKTYENNGSTNGRFVQVTSDNGFIVVGSQQVSGLLDLVRARLEHH